MYVQVQVGAGTTPGSFQIQRPTDIHAPLGLSLITGDLSHGTEMYITVIAENYAGLKRVFQSNFPVLIDHTPPTVRDLDVSVKVFNGNDTGNKELRQDVGITWTVTDRESGIKYCTCTIGKYNTHSC